MTNVPVGDGDAAAGRNSSKPSSRRTRRGNARARRSSPASEGARRLRSPTRLSGRGAGRDHQGRRVTLDLSNLPTVPEADARTRTGDPFITSEVLYQLSYVGGDGEV